ncbi:hypothetical protein A3K64_03675 [Candidatus Micrarchaeota archaeon RBG_16_36_9]|nr:MAG: hypothetical protein A3K64_03675 [Candidatus Micrarchaeota archaeon RBG_16_36_9]
MIDIRSLLKEDKKQLLVLAVDFFKKNQRGEIVSKKLLPLIKYKNYDSHLKKDVRKYMELNHKKEAIFVAEEEGILIGYVYGRIVLKPKMVLSRIGIIEDWFVNKEYRGKGVSMMLWNRLMEWFRDKKCDRLELDVYTTNKHAIDVYHKMGFLNKTIVMTKKF